MFIESKADDIWVNVAHVSCFKIRRNLRNIDEYVLVAITTNDTDVVLDIDHNCQKLKDSLRSYLAQIEKESTSMGR